MPVIGDADKAYRKIVETLTAPNRLESFSDSDIVSYLESRGYTVFDPDSIIKDHIKVVKEFTTVPSTRSLNGIKDLVLSSFDLAEELKQRS